MMQNKLYLIGFLVIGLVLGLGAGYFVFQNAAQTQVANAQTQVDALHLQVANLTSQVTELNAQVKQNKLDVETKAYKFGTKFHDLLQEHDFMLINTARRSLDAANSYNDSRDALQVNINEVADQIKGVYGQRS